MIPVRAPALIMLLAVPLLELALLIKLGSTIGFWRTMAIVIGTAIAGVLVLRSQGLASLRQANEAMRLDRPPVEPVLDGAMRLLGGILLITPGVLMDIVGLTLLVPPLRRLLARRIIARAESAGSFRVKVFRQRGEPRSGEGNDKANPQRPGRAAPGPVIEGEFERLEERTFDRKRDPRPPDPER